MYSYQNKFSYKIPLLKVKNRIHLKWSIESILYSILYFILVNSMLYYHYYESTVVLGGKLL